MFSIALSDVRLYSSNVMRVLVLRRCPPLVAASLSFFRYHVLKVAVLSEMDAMGIPYSIVFRHRQHSMEGLKTVSFKAINYLLISAVFSKVFIWTSSEDAVAACNDDLFSV